MKVNMIPIGFLYGTYVFMQVVQAVWQIDVSARAITRTNMVGFCSNLYTKLLISDQRN